MKLRTTTTAAITTVITTSTTTPPSLTSTTVALLRFCEGADYCVERATEVIGEFKERMDRDEVNDFEKVRFVHNWFARCACWHGDLSLIA